MKEGKIIKMPIFTIRSFWILSQIMNFIKIKLRKWRENHE
jgi:hypothetical protein